MLLRWVKGQSWLELWRSFLLLESTCLFNLVPTSARSLNRGATRRAPTFQLDIAQPTDPQPCNCGIGGDVFALFYSSSTRTVSALNGSGRSPKALTLSKAREIGFKGSRIPGESVHGVTVPGSAAAWVDLVEKWGSGRLGLGEILEVSLGVASWIRLAAACYSDRGGWVRCPPPSGS